MKRAFWETAQMAVNTIFITTVAYQTLKVCMWMEQRGRY